MGAASALLGGEHLLEPGGVAFVQGRELGFEFLDLDGLSFDLGEQGFELFDAAGVFVDAIGAIDDGRKARKWLEASCWRHERLDGRAERHQEECGSGHVRTPTYFLQLET